MFSAVNDTGAQHEGEGAMWCVAICRDVEGASERTALFEAHVQHNLAHIGAFLFTAPVARADGSTGIGDDPRLCGSIYCLDVADVAAARRIMEADPFMRGAWGRIDYYEWRGAEGAWSSESARPKGLSADYRVYVAAFAGGEPPAAALMRGALIGLGSTGEAPERLSALALLRANTMGEAESLAPGAAWIYAAPVAIGRFVGIASVADVPLPG